MLSVRDDGSGIPEEVRQILEGLRPSEPDGPHIMGLRIVSQITSAHGGHMRFSADGREVLLYLPVARTLEEKNKKKKAWWEILWYGEGRAESG